MIFLKLGGSLITDKSKLQTPRTETIARLAAEIGEAFQTFPKLKLLLGHGSGSFGHPVAERYGTHHGAKTTEDWLGFVQVWAIANRLNRLVIDALLEASLPAMSMPPSACVLSKDGKIVEMATEPIQRAINAGLIPVVQGDVAFDILKGSTILSTEDVFHYLAPHLQPSLVLFAGIEPGVYRDYPSHTELLPVVTEDALHSIQLGSAQGKDVTGGMADKVHHAFALCKIIPGVEVRIFSGEIPGNLCAALCGTPLGTLIQSMKK